jgi:hypothetical protein
VCQSWALNSGKNELRQGRRDILMSAAGSEKFGHKTNKANALELNIQNLNETSPFKIKQKKR